LICKIIGLIAGHHPSGGAEVVSRAAAFLDAALPLAKGAHGDVARYGIVSTNGKNELEIHLLDGTVTSLSEPAQFLGHSGSANGQALLFVNNGLHFEIQIDRTNPVGPTAPRA
jgi:malate synthase